MNCQTFLSDASDYGILDPEQVAAISHRFTAEASLDDLTRALVDKGWLTAYQLDQIWAGKAKGLVLGQYRILEELGRGGFGCVYKARHLIMNRVVALKVISPELIDDAVVRARFRAEVLANTQLQHPNIAMAYDANEVDETLFLVMEYVDGPNLAEVVKKQGPLPIGHACHLLLQAARALQYAHEQGMVHRDIKPANLLLPKVAAPDQSAGAPSAVSAYANQILVKVVDFGLARLQAQGSASTLMGFKEKSFAGTPEYVSPEQARDIHDVDIRADLYSLGCTFFFALTSRPPFRGKHPLEIVLQHVEKEPPALDIFRPDAPPALANIIRRLMAKKPEQRFQTPSDLVAELNFFFGSGALLSANPSSPLPTSSGLQFSPLPQLIPSPTKCDPRVTLIPAFVRVTDVRTPTAATDDQAELDMPRTAVVEMAATLETITPPKGETPAPKLGVVIVPEKPETPAREWAPGNPDLADLWRLWLAVVQNLASGRSSEIDEATYSDLYRALLAAVRCQLQCDNVPSAMSLAEAVVEPWLSLRILASTDAPTLQNLLLRCCELELQIGIAGPTNRAGRWALFALLFIASVILGAVAIKGGVNISLSGFPFASLSHWVTTNAMLTISCLLPPLVLVVAYVVTRRSHT